jgi:hypothetical protein
MIFGLDKVDQVEEKEHCLWQTWHVNHSMAAVTIFYPSQMSARSLFCDHALSAIFGQPGKKKMTSEGVVW